MPIVVVEEEEDFSGATGSCDLEGDGVIDEVIDSLGVSEID
jgi:hypothetical protein